MTDTQQSLSARISDRLTSWVGSPASIVVHTLFFAGIFGLIFINVSLEHILLILTTAVSLEAIYLAIFIQMTVNRHTQSLHDVEEDIEDLEDDLEDIGEDIDRIQEGETQEERRDRESHASLENIETTLQRLLADVEALKNRDR